MLREKLTINLKEALKAQDELKVSVLRMLLAAIRNREIEKRAKLAKEGKVPETLGEEEVLEVVMSEAKKRREAIEGCEKGGRTDLAAKEKQELAILEAYLPPQLSDEEIVKEIEAAIQTTGAASEKDIGRVMGYLSAKLKGRADMAKVSNILRARLGKD